jgi:hypothetical protein
MLRVVPGDDARQEFVLSLDDICRRGAERVLAICAERPRGHGCRRRCCFRPCRGWAPEDLAEGSAIAAFFCPMPTKASKRCSSRAVGWSFQMRRASPLYTSMTRLAASTIRTGTLLT